jgi:hypothetical protein
MRRIKEVVLKHHRYDVFQNQCCQAISHSKLSCNSNLQFVTQGPLAIYTFWYCFKGTQNEDASRFVHVIDFVRKFLEKIRAKLSNPDDDSTPRSLAIQMVLASCRAHQKENVISPLLASYLLRDESRFLFSHHAVWCPVFESILLGGKAFTTLKHVDKEPIFVSAAMHYLCRPQELFHVNVFDFYSQYEIIDFTGKMKRGKEIFEFTNGEFTHPSYSIKTNTMLQCIVKRKTKALICVPQYTFPDTASFNGSILDQNTKSNEEMELYAKMVLILFCQLEHTRN